jgi:tetraacyldisaccharide 4'-kinase
MPRAPSFWLHDGVAARLLSPLSLVGTALTARRVARPGWQAPVPVICCGNVTVGGAGKTTLVLDLARRLVQRGRPVHVLLRGYGGSARGVKRVAADDPAALVGDEALLLASVAPTWIGGDRAASGRAAVQAGADVLLMDDGLQNPTLTKSFAILVVDGATGFGNGRVLPAGPLREPVAAAASRCRAAVLIGSDVTGALSRLDLPVLRAGLVQEASIAALAGQRVLAFAGIAIPEKFFGPLRRAGAVVAAVRAFPDHHPYSARDLDALRLQAEALDARLVTTPKDAVRLPPAFRPRVTVIGVGLEWEDRDGIERLLDAALS